MEVKNIDIQELQTALEYAREQLFQVELKLDQTTEPELIDANIYERQAWETRFEFYRKKLKEAVAGGQAIQRNRLVSFGGRR